MDTPTGNTQIAMKREITKFPAEYRVRVIDATVGSPERLNTGRSYYFKPRFLADHYTFFLWASAPDSDPRMLFVNCLTCRWDIGLPGGSSPRPPFSRFARRAVVGRADLLTGASDLDVQSRQ
jgi:hypothetical protein